MGQLGLHEPYANQFLPTSRLILNSILCRRSCGSLPRKLDWVRHERRKPQHYDVPESI